MMLEEYLRRWKPLIDRKIFDSLGSGALWERAGEYPARGGKRLRPVMVLLGAREEGSEEGALGLAAAVELVHNFTLIHDDIEDSSRLRRGKPCLHIEHGVPLAINAGDALFASAFRLAAPYGKEVVEFLARTVERVAEGQDMDLRWVREDYWPDEKEYFEMVEKKTGELMGASLYLGALSKGVERRDLYEFGKRLGVAFQLRDDLLNLVGDEGKMGKDWGSDITEGKRTLMAIKSLSPELRGLMGTGRKEGIRRAIELMEQGIEYAERAARKLVDIPVSARDPTVRAVLEELKGLVVEREK